MNNLEQLIKVLDEGAFITHEEMSALAKEVRALQVDAARYQWLTQHTAHLFHLTEKGLDQQVDILMEKDNE